MNDLHEKALQYARDYKKGESNLVSVLIEVDATRLFEKKGYSSLFSYCVSALELGESHAGLLISVARKSREIPELRSLQISKARQILPVITKENKQEWLEKATTLSQRSLEKEVAKAKPEMKIREKLKPVTPTKSELRVGIPHDLEAKLERLKDLLSQKLKRACSLEDVLVAVTEEYLERHDPVKRAARRKGSIAVTVPSTKQGKRIPLPASIRHEVARRDQGRCTFSSGGKRCEQKRWLQIHHKQPVGRGGLHAASNLATLCSTHHRYEHDGPWDRGRQDSRR